MNGVAALPLALQPKRAFHHLDAAPSDMRGSNHAVLSPDPRQQQARPPQVKTLPDAQLQLAITFARQVREQRRGRYRSAAGGGSLGGAAQSRKEHPRLQIAALSAGNVAGVEIDRVAAVARKRPGEGRC